MQSENLFWTSKNRHFLQFWALFSILSFFNYLYGKCGQIISLKAPRNYLEQFCSHKILLLSLERPEPNTSNISGFAEGFREGLCKGSGWLFPGTFARCYRGAPWQFWKPFPLTLSGNLSHSHVDNPFRKLNLSPISAGAQGISPISFFFQIC